MSELRSAQVALVGSVQLQARKPSDVRAHILADTIVLHGTNTVEQWLPDVRKFKTARSQFMRTDVQTMNVYSDEGQ